MSSESVPHSCAWKIAFADFMMAMFIIFLVLWITNLEKKEQKAISDYFKSGGESLVIEADSFGDNPQSTTMEKRKFKPEPKKTEMISKINQTLDYFFQFNNMNGFKKEVNSDSIKLTIASDQTFESGEADIKPIIESKLIRMSETLMRKDKDAFNGLMVEIHGHTDNQPIENYRFRSNWDLSSARASSVANIFMDSGLLSKNIKVIGFADGQPIVQNNSTVNRAKNRRVEIFIKERPFLEQK